MEFLLEKQIADLVQSCVLRKDPDQKIWRKTRTGFALIQDRPFHKLRTWVRKDHLMPEDMLPGAESVVSFFLPFTKDITCSNNEGVPASRVWGDAFTATNDLIDEINDEISYLLEAGGFNCVRQEAAHNFDEESLTSRWSHRHVAYLSGLGTFGRNNLLITESGCSGRLGSLVTDAPLSSTPLPEKEFCIEKRGKKCSFCVGRCAKGALTAENYNRSSCFEQCLANAQNLGHESRKGVCGKCITKLPCTFTVPA